MLRPPISGIHTQFFKQSAFKLGGVIGASGVSGASGAAALRRA